MSFGAVAQQDDLAVLIETYMAESQELRSRPPSPEERIEFLRTWLDRFLNGLAMNPDSPSRNDAIAKSVGLANGLGDWEISKSLSAELAGASKGDAGSVFWLLEQGHVTLNSYYTTGNAAELDEALELLAKALKRAEADDPGEHPDVRARAVAGGVSLARTLSKHGRATAQEVASLFDSLAKITHNLPPDVYQRQNASGYGPERLATEKLYSAMDLQSDTLATTALEELLLLAKNKSLKSHFASHLLRYGERTWPEKGASFREFLADWIARADDDPWRAYVYYAILTSAHSDHACDEVLHYGQLLLGESGEILRESDAKRPDAPNSYAAEIYGRMAECSSLLGLQKQTVEFKSLLQAHSPNNHRLNNLRIEAESQPEKTAEPAPLRSWQWQIWANAVFFVIAATWFIIFRFKRPPAPSDH